MFGLSPNGERAMFDTPFWFASAAFRPDAPIVTAAGDDSLESGGLVERSDLVAGQPDGG